MIAPLAPCFKAVLRAALRLRVSAELRPVAVYTRSDVGELGGEQSAKSRRKRRLGELCFNCLAWCAAAKFAALCAVQTGPRSLVPDRGLLIGVMLEGVSPIILK